MTVLTAIPYYGVPSALIDKAVTCALRQIVTDHVVLVVGDGQVPPVTVRHDRLVVGSFPTNHGAPFVQQAMLLGSPFEWYAPHGADDWTERTHLASLAAMRHRATGSSQVWWHQPAVRPKLLRSSRTWIEFGLFRTDLLRAIGGYNPAEPCGQDSVVISLLLKTSGVRLTRTPTYHKVFRADSLTHHPDTKQGSPLRVAVKGRNRAVLLACERLGWKPDAIRAYRESLVPAGVQTDLEDAASLVAKWLL